MKLYVAGKYEDKMRVREVMDQFITAGHSITYDWTTNEQVSQDQAMADMAGVAEADAVVLVVEKALPYAGTLVEFGIALAYGKPVYLIGSGINHCIFSHLPGVHRGIDAILKKGVTDV